METKYIDEINTIEELIDRSKDTNIIYRTEDTILNTKAVQKIANRLEQLEEKNKELKFENILAREENDYLHKNYIPKSVIREKIDKLEEKLKEIDIPYICDPGHKTINLIYDYKGKINLYKELLGEEII